MRQSLAKIRRHGIWRVDLLTRLLRLKTHVSHIFRKQHVLACDYTIYTNFTQVDVLSILKQIPLSKRSFRF